MLRVKNLNLKTKEKSLLQGISLNLEENRVLGVLGQSGAGKSLLLKSLIRLLNKDLILSAEELSVAGLNALNLSSLNELRTRAGFIFQDARASFHPMFNMGELFDLHLKERLSLNKRQRKELSFKWLENLQLDCELMWHSYAHQLSTGMAMRVQLALILALGAKILLCDELTSSLDQTNTKIIISIFKELKKEKSIVLISHDLNLIKELSDKIIVLEEGKIVEKSSAKDFFLLAKADYCKTVLGEDYAFKG